MASSIYNSVANELRLRVVNYLFALLACLLACLLAYLLTHLLAYLPTCLGFAFLGTKNVFFPVSMINSAFSAAQG